MTGFVNAHKRLIYEVKKPTKLQSYRLPSRSYAIIRTGNQVSSEFKYRAFISYSHKDEKWAAWLHKALETFKVPKYLVGETTSMGIIPSRTGKVFRDREELSSSHSLGTELTLALEDLPVRSSSALQTRRVHTGPTRKFLPINA